MAHDQAVLRFCEVELCALSGAVLADPDGVYDPGEYNDRLLLGLKGTRSEAELHPDIAGQGGDRLPLGRGEGARAGAPARSEVG